VGKSPLRNRHGGGRILEVAAVLSVSEATAKTHFSRILAKTKVGRQAELVALVRDLVPPLTAAPN
jgi:DNA-binding CsgD family transcriptional regulator